MLRAIGFVRQSRAAAKAKIVIAGMAERPFAARAGGAEGDLTRRFDRHFRHRPGRNDNTAAAALAPDRRGAGRQAEAMRLANDGVLSNAYKFAYFCGS